MNNEDDQAAADWVSIAEAKGHCGIAISIKGHVRINDRVVVLCLIEQRVFAARGDHQVFNTVAIEVAGHGANFRHEREVLAELFVDEIVINSHAFLREAEKRKQKD